jgi:hypothetical protein
LFILKVWHINDRRERFSLPVVLDERSSRVPFVVSVFVIYMKSPVLLEQPGACIISFSSACSAKGS